MARTRIVRAAIVPNANAFYVLAMLCVAVAVVHASVVTVLVAVDALSLQDERRRELLPSIASCLQHFCALVITRVSETWHIIKPHDTMCNHDPKLYTIDKQVAALT